MTGPSRTWVVTDGDAGRVVAYYASATGSILRAAAPTKLARNQPAELPAVLLARLAVDAAHRGRGLGAAVLKHLLEKALEVSDKVGLRILLVHAQDDRATGFYRHHGFLESPIDPLTMMMLVPGR